MVVQIITGKSQGSDSNTRTLSTDDRAAIEKIIFELERQSN
jgi:hypothetical protein